jgi:coenzyme PQQ synthesis protein D (PqqD)
MGVRLSADVSTAETGGGLVLLDERAGRYWQLNRTGALILSTLLDGATPAHAAEILADRHTVSVEKAIADVSALLEHLSAADLVTQTDQVNLPGRRRR